MNNYMNLETIGLTLSVIAIPVFVVGLFMLIIQAIRKKKKKASLIVMLVAVLVFVGGFGLALLNDGTSSGDSGESIEESIERRAESYIIVKCKMTYECKTVQVNVTTVEVAGDVAIAKGKVSVIDDYGDRYEAKFDYTAKISDEGELYSESLDMPTPTKAK